MYINFHKYNYDLVDSNEKNNYEARDKRAYKEILQTWFDDNVEDFISRKWEIEEIYYLKEISDFINLVREAEKLYELGFFTSCIALVGISAEDYTKYISLKQNYSEQVKKQHKNMTQDNRLKKQLEDKIIDQNTYELLDHIRRIRNDCLHYNDNFKQKSEQELKKESLSVLNSLKAVLKSNIGTALDPKDIINLIDELCNEDNHRNFDEISWKQRNLMSHVLDFPMAFDPDIQTIRKEGIYEVIDIDEQEVGLKQVYPPINGGYVYVDIDLKGAELLDKYPVEVGTKLIASIYSNISSDGISRIWFFHSIKYAK